MAGRKANDLGCGKGSSTKVRGWLVHLQFRPPAELEVWPWKGGPERKNVPLLTGRFPRPLLEGVQRFEDVSPSSFMWWRVGGWP